MQSRRPRGCCDHVNRIARLLLAGEGEALTRAGFDQTAAAGVIASPRVGAEAPPEDRLREAISGR